MVLGKAEQRSKRPLSLRSPQRRVKEEKPGRIRRKPEITPKEEKEEKADRPAHLAQFGARVTPGRHQFSSRRSAAAIADHQHCEHVHALDGE